MAVAIQDWGKGENDGRNLPTLGTVQIDLDKGASNGLNAANHLIVKDKERRKRSLLLQRDKDMLKRGPETFQRTQ